MYNVHLNRRLLHRYGYHHSSLWRWRLVDFGKTRNLAIANRSRVGCAHKLTTVNFQPDPRFPLHRKRVAALSSEMLNIKK